MKFFPMLLAISIVAPLASEPLPGCRISAKWGERREALDVATDGRFIWTASGAGIVTYDASDRERSRVVSDLRTPSRAFALTRTSEGLAVLTERELIRYRLEDATPVRIASVPLAQARGLAASGSRVAVAFDRHVLFFDDIAGTAPPRNIPASAPIDAIEVTADLILLAERGRGLRLLRIDGSETVVPVKALDVVVDGDVAYVAAGEVGIFVISTVAGEIVKLVEPSTADFRELERVGSRLAAVSSNREIRTFDLADRRAPRLISTLPFESADIAFLSESELLGWERFETAVGVVSVQPSELILFRDGNVVARLEDSSVFIGVALHGRYAYVVDAPHLRVVDLAADGGPAEVASIRFGDASTEVRIEGSLLLVYGISNVHIVDISVARAPRLLGVYRALGAPPSGAAMAGRYLLEGNKPTGFHVVDISNPANPVQVTGLKNDGLGQVYGTVGVEGASYNFVSFGIKVVDLSTGVATVVNLIDADEYVVDGDVIEATTSAPRMLVLSDGPRLRFFDISDRLRPVEISTVTIGFGGEIAIDGSDVWMLSANGELVLVDASDSRSPVVVQNWDAIDSANGIDADGGRAILTTRYETMIFERDATAGEVPRIRRDGSRFLVEGDANRFYEVETAREASFANASSRRVLSGSAVVLRPGDRYVRARAAGSCESVAWSAIATADALEVRRRGAR